MAFKRGFKREKGKKYNNTKIECEDGKFDSKKEYQRWLVLKDAQEQGIITDLQRQVKFVLIPAVTEDYVVHLKTKDKIKTRTLQLAITYTADFQYIKDAKLVVEDVKASPKMDSLDKAFLIKEKLFRWKFGFPIKRVYGANDTI